MRTVNVIVNVFHVEIVTDISLTDRFDTARKQYT